MVTSKRLLFQPFTLTLIAVLTLTECMRGALILAVLPLYVVKHLGMAKTISGAALSVHYLLDNVLRSPAGWVVDRFGPRVVLTAGIGVAFLGLWGLSVAHTAWAIIAWAGCLGIGLSPLWPSVVSGCTKAVSESDRASMMGMIYMAWLCGSGIGILGANFLLNPTTYLPVFLSMGAALAVAFVVAFFLRRPRTNDAAVKRHVRPIALLGVLKELGVVKRLFPGMFAQTFALGLLIPILSLYAEDVLGLTAKKYSSILLVAGAIVFLLLLPIGRLVDRFGPKPFLVAGFILAGIFLGLFPSLRALEIIFAGVAALAAAYALILPSWNSILDRSIARDKKGTVWGVFMTIEGMGTAAGPIVSGRLYDSFGPSAPFYASASVLIAMSIVYWFMPIARLRARK